MLNFCLGLDVQPEIKTWKLSIQWLQAGNFISQQEFGVCCVKPYLQYLLHNPLIICLIKEHLQSSYEWMRPFSYEDCCHLSNLKNIVTPIKEFLFGLAGYLVKKSNNLQSIYNTIHCFTGLLGQMTRRPNVWCSKYHFSL